jgi:hypothetical protein
MPLDAPVTIATLPARFGGLHVASVKEDMVWFSQGAIGRALEINSCTFHFPEDLVVYILCLRKSSLRRTVLRHGLSSQA